MDSLLKKVDHKRNKDKIKIEIIEERDETDIETNDNKLNGQSEINGKHDIDNQSDLTLDLDSIKLPDEEPAPPLKPPPMSQADKERYYKDLLEKSREFIIMKNSHKLQQPPLPPPLPRPPPPPPPPSSSQVPVSSPITPITDHVIFQYLNNYPSFQEPVTRTTITHYPAPSPTSTMFPQIHAQSSFSQAAQNLIYNQAFKQLDPLYHIQKNSFQTSSRGDPELFAKLGIPLNNVNQSSIVEDLVVIKRRRDDEDNSEESKLKKPLIKFVAPKSDEHEKSKDNENHIGHEIEQMANLTNYGKGASIAMKMGFNPGEGLGKDSQGTRVPIESKTEFNRK